MPLVSIAPRAAQEPPTSSRLTPPSSRRVSLVNCAASQAGVSDRVELLGLQTSRSLHTFRLERPGIAPCSLLEARADVLECAL